MKNIILFSILVMLLSCSGLYAKRNQVDCRNKTEYTASLIFKDKDTSKLYEEIVIPAKKSKKITIPATVESISIGPKVSFFSDRKVCTPIIINKLNKLTQITMSKKEKNGKEIIQVHVNGNKKIGESLISSFEGPYIETNYPNYSK